MRIGVIVLAAIAGALLLRGCTHSSGSSYDPARVSEVKVGQTTYDQILTSFGTPLLATTKSDGTRVLMYGRTTATARPATFIPVVGLFPGGADSHQESVTFSFDKDGVLKEYATSQSQACSGTGVYSDVTPENCKPAGANDNR